MFEASKESTLLAEIYFRLHVDQILHQRKVNGFLNFLGTIGGIIEVLKNLTWVIYGSYASFHYTMSAIEIMYKVKRNNNKVVKDIAIPTSRRLCLFL